MAKGISIDEAKQQMHDKALKAMKESVLLIEADAKLLVGVDTGHLRRNITHQVEDKGEKIEGQVGTTNVEYAFFHALQNPYLENAVDMNLEQIRRKMKEVLSGD